MSLIFISTFILILYVRFALVINVTEHNFSRLYYVSVLFLVSLLLVVQKIHQHRLALNLTVPW